MRIPRAWLLRVLGAERTAQAGKRNESKHRDSGGPDDVGKYALPFSCAAQVHPSERRCSNLWQCDRTSIYKERVHKRGKRPRRLQVRVLISLPVRKRIVDNDPQMVSAEIVFNPGQER